ncbi:hypothetical protein QUB36_29695 [Microcoleus sp. AT8-B1]|uniref:hypothetical protein n=1 Tax=unclassified Microcoleus TaxID=2642155 RepID=UPI002FD37C16
MQTQLSKSFTDVHVLRYQGDLFFRVYSDNHLPVSVTETLQQLETAYPDDLQPCTVREVKVFVFGGAN